MQTREDLRQQSAVWFAELGRQEKARVVRNTPRGDVIHDVVIEGQQFSAAIFSRSILVGTGDGWSCALGVASINSKHLDGPGWAVCKYWNQRHLDLNLSAAGRRALALEFGLPIVPEIGYLDMHPLTEYDFFYLSPAFESLVTWASKHPRKIRKVIGDDYLGLWPLAAMKGHPVPATAENIEFARGGYRGPCPFDEDPDKKPE